MEINRIVDGTITIFKMFPSMRMLRYMLKIFILIDWFSGWDYWPPSYP